MLIITIHVDAPPGQAIGIKEDLAMYLEQYGDARVISVSEQQKNYRQLRFFDGSGQQSHKGK